jgi:uncharacterized membrane protein YcaP (DUF421 family)
MGNETSKFLIEVILRSFIMFIVILTSLRILGKRSVGQLSVFELGVIIGLGSATGDPMFYREVGLLPGIMAFAVVIGMYRFMTFLVNHYRVVEKSFEGVPTYIAELGKFNLENFRKETIAHEEFFAQLRQIGITHLGQVKLAVLETTGSISVVCFADKDVKWVLPVLPHMYANKLTKLPAGQKYACAYCGHVEETTFTLEEHECPVCQRKEWVPAINEIRNS